MLETLWQRLAKMGGAARTVVKLLLVAVVLAFALFPNPVLLVKQVDHLQHVDSLIQPDLPGMDGINDEINRRLTNGTDLKAEAKVVERFVNEKIRYQYDWYNWANVDYWPTASEVWERKREDCDGRAVLAASILRHRGHTNVQILGNLQHVWVKVDDIGLMGAMSDTNFKKVDGKTVITLPQWQTLIDGTAMICKFPVWRTLVVYLTILTLVFHPHRDSRQFTLLLVVGFAGWLLFLDWAGQRVDEEAPVLAVELVLGSLGIAGSVIAAWFAKRWEAGKGT